MKPFQYQITTWRIHVPFHRLMKSFAPHSLVVAALMVLMTCGTVVAAEPGPYEVIFYQGENYTGLSDTYRIEPTQAYSAFRPDEILATRHFIKSIKLGAKVGVTVAYDNCVAIAHPRFANLSKSTPSLGTLNWYVLSTIVYNRDIVNHPEGAKFSNLPTGQSAPSFVRREIFVLANQAFPGVEVLGRHGMRYMTLYGPNSPAPPAANFDQPAETRVTLKEISSDGEISVEAFGQLNQGAWLPEARYDLGKTVDPKRITEISVTGSQRIYRQTSDGDDKSPGMKVIGLPPLADAKLAPGGSPTAPISPNNPPGGLSKIQPGQSKWKSSHGVLSLKGTPAVMPGNLTRVDGGIDWVIGWIDSEGVQLIVYNRTGQPIATGQFKESADGKTATGFWADVPSGMPEVWKLNRDQS